MKGDTQAVSNQLAFDFEAGFDNLLDTAKKLEESIDDRESSGTVARGSESVANNKSGADQQGAFQSVRMEDRGPLGDELAGSSEGVGTPGGSGAVRPVAETANDGTGDPAVRHVGRDDGLGNPDDARSEHRAVTLQNYRITATDDLGSGGPKAKFRDNIAAIQTLKQIEREQRGATSEEQAILVRYVGWGGLPQAFDHRNTEWAQEFQELSALLTSSEYEDARRSTQDAHYTPEVVVRGIYSGVQRLGFTTGRLIDPAVGTGHFIGLLPEELSQSTEVTGIELDSLTSRIASIIYPEASIINRGFQEVLIPKGYFDVVVGNFPYGNQSVYDAQYPDLSKLSIHNYFTAKSMDNLRPGGIMATVISSYFMDGKDETARSLIADQAHLLGAIRLPYDSFKQNALVEVTTDILFFQKALEGETPDRSWVQVGDLIDEATDIKMPVNQYFMERPEMMLGTMKMVNLTFRGGNAALVGHDGLNLSLGISQALEKLPAKVYQPAVEQKLEGITKKDQVEIPERIKVGAYFIAEVVNGEAVPNGRLARRVPDILGNKNYEWVEVKNEVTEARIRGLVRVRTALRELMTAEQSDFVDGDYLENLRSRLNVVYDGFVKRQGFISSLVMKQAIGDDPEYPLLLALERDYDKGISNELAKKNGVEARQPSAKKAAIFSKRVMSPMREITSVETGKEALVVSMNELGRVDIARMVQLTGKSEEALIHELAGLIYLNPVNHRWESSEQYLSGNVKEKLKAAVAAAERDSKYLDNVAALEQVQPADIEPIDIAVQLGTSWVPEKVVSDFVTHILGDVNRNIAYQPSLGKWIAKISAADRTTTHTTWGTEDIGAHHLVEQILTNSDISVKDVVGRNERNEPIYKINEGKTAAANQKADEIKQAFEDWIWEDKDRRSSLARLYNDRFNTNIATKYDGSHLTLPGASLTIHLRKHQKNAIWRGILDGYSLFDHRVGAGKTYVKIATAMESKRMGLLNKPMFVVPNHLLLQWKDSFYELYPGANILIAEKSDFKKENRQKLFSKIATGDWDAVIVAHSSFKRIGVPRETLEEILNEQVWDITDAVISLKAGNGDRLSIKQLEKTKDRIEAKLARAAETGTKDNTVSFADLGVDALFVDESQEFKNLFITTSMTRVAGLGNLEGSEKAFDMFVKTRYIQKKYDGRGIFHGTGTPISNTIAELYTVQRYMQYDELKSRGIVHFDAWASTFGKVVTGWELDATGMNYRLNSRFSKFQNVPELTALYRSFADVISKDDLMRFAQEEGKRFPVPKVKGGRPENVIVPRSSFQAQYMGVQIPVTDNTGLPMLRADGTQLKTWTPGSIIYRMENLPDNPSIDNPLKITNDARKAGLDYRLVDPDAPDVEITKVNEMVDRVHGIWTKWSPVKGTQLVFCDLSTPKGGKKEPLAIKPENDLEEDADEPETISMDELLSAESTFNVYDDVRAKLIKRGIPAEQIRFIHEAKTDLQKSKLFDEMNRGVVRLLIGSTAKMGAGTNVQKKLVAEHHLDAPWRPADLEQRDGRIERQGNELYEADPDGFEVEIIRYATEKTYDGRMWQTIEVKASAIEQFRKGDALQRVIEDVASEAANAAEMKAAATGNPLIFMQVQLSTELKKFEALYSSYKRSRHALEGRIEWLSKAEERHSKASTKWNAEIERRDAYKASKHVFEVNGKKYGEDDKEALLNVVMTAMKAAIDEKASKVEKIEPIGKYRGFDIGVYADRHGVQFVITGNENYQPSNLEYDVKAQFSLGGFLTRIDNFLGSFEETLQQSAENLMSNLSEYKKAQLELSKIFPHQQRLELLRKDAADVLIELKKLQDNDAYVSAWKPQSQSAVNTLNIVQSSDEGNALLEVLGPDKETVMEMIQDKAAMAVDMERGYYRGSVMHISDHHYVQNVGKKYIAIHEKSRVDGVLQIGDMTEIRYKDGRGAAQVVGKKTDLQIVH